MVRDMILVQAILEAIEVGTPEAIGNSLVYDVTLAGYEEAILSKHLQIMQDADLIEEPRSITLNNEDGTKSVIYVATRMKWKGYELLDSLRSSGE